MSSMYVTGSPSRLARAETMYNTMSNEHTEKGRDTMSTALSIQTTELPTNISEESVALMKSYGLAISARDRMVMKANLEGGDSQELTYRDLPKIHAPGPGSRYFELPTGAAESFDCILVAQTFDRRYYVTVYDPNETTPPDCYSRDLRTGIGNPGGPCLHCEFNQYGSSISPDGGEGKGKACVQHRYFFVHLEGSGPIPRVLVCSPTSLKAARNYLLSLVTECSVPYFGVVTHVGLQPGAAAVPTLTFTMVRELDDEVLAFMAGKNQAVSAIFAEADLLDDEPIAEAQ